MAADSLAALILYAVGALASLAGLTFLVLGLREWHHDVEPDPETEAWRTIARGGSVHS